MIVLSGSPTALGGVVTNYLLSLPLFKVPARSKILSIYAYLRSLDSANVPKANLATAELIFSQNGFVPAFSQSGPNSSSNPGWPFQSINNYSASWYVKVDQPVFDVAVDYSLSFGAYFQAATLAIDQWTGHAVINYELP